MSADSEKRKLSTPKTSSRDGNMLKYLVRAQPSSTEAATLSFPDSDDDQTPNRAEPDNNNPTPKPMKPLFSRLHFVTSQAKPERNESETSNKL